MLNWLAIVLWLIVHSVIIVLSPILLTSSKSTRRIWCQSIVSFVYNQICKHLLFFVLFYSETLFWLNNKTSKFVWSDVHLKA